MPDQKMQATFQRRVLVLEAIRSLSKGEHYLSDRWVKASEVVEHLKKLGYPVEKHNVLRDLKALKETYHQLECNDNSVKGKTKRGEAYGYIWRGIDPPPDGGLSIPEALSVSLVERYLQRSLPATLLTAFNSVFKQAENTLALHKKSKESHWLDKICVVEPVQPVIAPSINVEVLKCIHECLLEGEQIKVEHQNIRGEAKSLQLSPYQLIQRGPVTYLLARASGYDDLRFYALHRINNCRRSYMPVSPIEIHQQRLAEIQAHFGSGASIELKARISSDLARRLRETPLDENQTIVEMPNVEDWILRACVADTWQLKWWIYSQSDAIEILEPSTLRTEIGEKLNRAASRYVEH